MNKNNKKQVNTNPGESPFRKGQKSDAYYGIPGLKEDIETSFDEFRAFSAPEGTEGSLMGNLWADAENMMNLRDSYAGVGTDFANQYAGITNTFGGLENRFVD